MNIPKLEYEHPLTSTPLPRYTKRHIRSTNGAPVVAVTGSDPIIFEDCVFVGNGDDIIKCPGYTWLTFKRCKFYADAHYKGEQSAKAINNYKPRYFDMMNCYTEGGSGVLLEQTDETSANQHYVRIKNNRFVNMSKAKADGTAGKQHCHAIQLSNVNGLVGAVISWNECINEPGKSWVEDIISIANCSFAPIGLYITAPTFMPSTTTS
jgi:hypothetical protein